MGAYTYEGLRILVDRIEFVLNAIPPEYQPSEMTKYTWLYSRLKKVRVMQSHIDRIKDASHGSHVKCWDWMLDKFKLTLLEMKEDQNKESLRIALQKQIKKKEPKPKKGNVAQIEEEGSFVSAAAAKPRQSQRPSPRQLWVQRINAKVRTRGSRIKQSKIPKGAKGMAKPSRRQSQNATNPPFLASFGPKELVRDALPFFHDPNYESKQSAAAAKSSPNPRGGESGW